MPLDQLHKIPQEIKNVPQWLCADKSKAPRDAKSGALADVTSRASYSDFPQASRHAQYHGRQVGFALTSGDPFTIIDLDDHPDSPATPEDKARFQTIIETFDSYTERSVSGRGFHIIVKGKVPAAVKRDHVEVHSDRHYFVMTGNVVRDRPIREAQQLLDQLYLEMKGADTPDPVELVDRESLLDDRDLVDMAMRAANADKFNSLCRGEWKELGYPSQSEADFALLSMLAFYSQDNEQVRRLFRMSALGKREKATRSNDYLNRSLAKIRASGGPQIDPREFLANNPASPPVVPEVRPAPPTPATTSPAASRVYERPPGLVGDLAEYFYRNAVRPTFEAALTGAIGFLAGVVGRQFNTYTGAGLNVYLILLARTGTGKEASKDGIDKIVSFIRPKVPAIIDFIGPTAFASGQAIAKVMEKKPCCVAILGEFGHTLKQITSDRAHGWEIHLQKTLLNIYSRSGKGKWAGESAYSSEEKNVKDVASPALTIVADSTPEVYFEAIEDQGCISSGLLPRFIPVEYQGDRPAPNEGANCDPPDELVVRVATLAGTVLSMASRDDYVAVPLDADAKSLLDAFNAEADAAIRGSDEVHRHIWNRAHLNALKVATILAVGDAPHNAVVNKVHADWAIKFIRTSVQTNLRHYERGEVGGGSQSKGEAILRKVIEKFVSMNAAERSKDDKIPATMRTGPFVPHAYLREHTKRVQPFKGDEHALKNLLDALTKDGALRKLPDPERNQRFKGNRGGDVYEVVNLK